MANWTLRRAGGVEVYLERLIAALVARGHSVAFVHEDDGPSDRPILGLPTDVEALRAAAAVTDGALEKLGQWKPDVVLTNVVHDRELEARLLDRYPAVFFAHAYYGVCVSGTRTHSFPAVRPCERALGPGCLLHYLPRRCGGLSPTTMVRRYVDETRRRELLSEYASVVTHSQHMRSVYVANGVAAERIRAIPFYVAGGEPVERSIAGDGEIVVLFAGRMDRLKGARVVLDALEPLQARLGRRVAAVLAGDGPDRPALEVAARRVMHTGKGIRVGFTGWLDGERLQAAFAAAHLLVVPSLWPEPFGQIGVEAGSTGLPAAAFDVGGISEWLEDGVSGHLAPLAAGSEGLAEAMAAAFVDSDHYRRLCKGAVAAAARYGAEAHLGDLLPVLEAAAGRAAAVWGR